MNSPTVSRGALLAWAGYDWATGAFFTVIVTFVFPRYFADAVVGDQDLAMARWSATAGAAALVVAVLGPGLGAAADRSRRKPWLGLMAAITAVAMAGLGLVRPEASAAWLAMGLVFVATASAELGMVFYNAMLPDLVPSRRLGRWSGWGWAAGYAGGLVCLVLVLFAVVAEDPWLPLPREDAVHLRLAFVGCALWYVLFALPLFLVTPDRLRSDVKPLRAIRDGYRQLVHSLRRLRGEGHILRFLVARMLYTDALTTVFAMGGLYAAGVLDLDGEGILVFGIAINVAAGVGAFGLSWVDDLIGPKRTILIALAAITVCVVGLLLADSPVPFWIAAMGLGLFLGPAQAASRSLMAHLAPADLRGECFGLFAFAGKATAFLGPWFVSLATTLSGSQRWGMATVLLFLISGGLVLLTVRRGSADGKGG